MLTMVVEPPPLLIGRLVSAEGASTDPFRIAGKSAGLGERTVSACNGNEVCPPAIQDEVPFARSWEPVRGFA
jgi:dissimilatory sulfite reductase (desulfoviridin) alpha/beta subunit